MRARPITLSTVAVTAFAATAVSQDIPISDKAGIVAVSDIHTGDLGGGAESPNGRFIVLNGMDNSFMRFDRRTKQWATASDVKIIQPRWSPDGRFVAYSYNKPGTRDRYVWVVPIDTSTGMPSGSPRRISTRSGSWPAWSSDAKRIAFASQDSAGFHLVVVPFNGGEDEILYSAPGRGDNLAWSPDGSYIFAGYGRTGPTYRLHVNVRTHKVDTIANPLARMLGYSADGKYYAAYLQSGISKGGLLTVFSAKDEKPVQRVRVPDFIEPTGWSKSQLGAFSALQQIIPSGLDKLSLPDGKITHLLKSDSLSISRVTVSPNGKRVAFIERGPFARRINVMDADGLNKHAIGNAGDIAELDWSPDGSRIAYVTNGILMSVHVVDLASNSDRALVTTSDTSGIAGTIRWRSDGAAIRYAWFPTGMYRSQREAREVTLAGQTRTLARIPIPPTDVRTIGATETHFMNDTLMLLRNGTGVEAVDLRTGASRKLYSGKMRPRNAFGVSPDGQWIAFAVWKNENSTPMLVSLATGEQKQVPYNLGKELGRIDFHPDGRSLISVACTNCTDNEYWDIVQIPLNGDPVRVLTASERGTQGYDDPSIARDGRTLFFDVDLSWNTRIVTLTIPPIR